MSNKKKKSIKIYHDDQPDGVVDKISAALIEHGVKIEWDGQEEDGIMTYNITVVDSPDTADTAQ